LRQVDGVTEINTIGGYTKEYHITPDPMKLRSYGFTFNDVVTAVDKNNGNVGAGYIERRGEQFLIRAPGQVRSLDDIRDTILNNVQGVPIRIRDVAEVAIGRELRTGAATENGREVVLGTVFMLIGENSRAVSEAVAERLVEINRSLPLGVKAVPVYDRTVLVDKAIYTVKKNLVEGAALVIAILFLFLGNMRAAFITATVIPLSMLFTFTGMVTYKVSANLMSLGALDFGIIIDGAVVIVENCVRRLALAQEKLERELTLNERFDEVFAAAKEARRPLMFGQLIIMVVYLPIFALTGVEGKMFHPMAFVVVTALLGAMLLSVTFIPAAVALFIGKRVAEKESRLILFAKDVYGSSLKKVMRHGRLVLISAVVVMIGSGILVMRMGSEFVPVLNEGDMAMQALRIPGTSLTQSLEMQKKLEAGLKARFPEIDRVFARTGTAEIASDPMPPNISDGYIMLKPETSWPEPKKARPELIAAIQSEAARYVGNAYEFSQPIQLRFNELISGVRSDVAVKVYGDNTEVLAQVGKKVANELQKIPGAVEVKVEQTDGLPMLTVNIDRAKTARYGLNIGDVQNVLATATGGQKAGMIFEGDRRFDILVRLPEQLRNDPTALSQLPVPLPPQPGVPVSFIPLSELAKLDVAPGPNQISRENGKRYLVVSANVRDRDIGSFVPEAQQMIAKKVSLPSGYWTSWGGTYAQLHSATQRLQVVVPIALLIVLTLLFVMFNQIKDGLIVFTGIPFALTGGIIALSMRGMPLSISAAIGFIALSGVAVLNGLVLIAYIRSLREQHMPLDEAISTGALTRLRPVLMTALVASLGFVPMALATGTGAEVQRPLATVVIGGILSSTLLTLIVLPLLYRIIHFKDEMNRTPSNERIRLS